MSAPDARPRQGLSRCINAPGGITMSDACARADLHLELLREKTIGVMADCLAGIGILNAQIDDVPTQEHRKEMHRLSCTIAALGGMFQRDGLSQAAYSFCRLIDATEPGWDAAAVAVHVSAMRLFFMPGRVAAEGQAKLIEGLLKVRRRVASPTEP